MSTSEHLHVISKQCYIITIIIIITTTTIISIIGRQQLNKEAEDETSCSFFHMDEFVREVEELRVPLFQKFHEEVHESPAVVRGFGVDQLRRECRKRCRFNLFAGHKNKIVSVIY